jgi:hypothetical protein
MSARIASSQIGPVFMSLPEIAGGDDVLIPGTFDFNTTGSTLSALVFDEDDTTGTPLDTLTVGDGITITPGAETDFTITIPRELAETDHLSNLYVTARLTNNTTGDVRTWLNVRLSYSWKVTRGA